MRLRLLSIAVFLLSATPVHAAFNDVWQSSPSYEAITYLQDNGVISGYADGTFKPDSRINRAEFVKILIAAQYIDTNGPGPGECLQDEYIFPDVHKTLWYASFACVAKSMGLVEGYPDGQFHGDRPINFVEAAKILAIENNLHMNTQGSEPWYKPYVLAMENAGAIPSSISSFDQKITRSEMAEMMWRLRENITDEPSLTYDDLAEWSAFTNYENAALGIRFLYPTIWGEPVEHLLSDGSHPGFKLKLGGVCEGCAEGEDAYRLWMSVSGAGGYTPRTPDDMTRVWTEWRYDGSRIDVSEMGGMCSYFDAHLVLGNKVIHPLDGACHHPRYWNAVMQLLDTVTLLPETPSTSANTEYYVRHNLETNPNLPIEDQYDGPVVALNTVTGQQRTIVNSVKDALPQLRERWNLTIDIFLQPAGSLPVFKTVLKETDNSGGDFYQLDPVKGVFTEMNLSKVYSGFYDGSAFSPNEHRVVWARQVDPAKIDIGLVQSLYIASFVDDSYGPLVTLSGNETLNSGQFALASSYDIQWLDNRTVRYAVYDQKKKESGQSSFIEYRTVTVDE
jgi:hypothetical protein